LKIIEELRGTIERDANQISDLKTKNVEAMKQNADLAKANGEKDLRILSLEKDLADNLKVMKDAKKKIKNNFEFLFGKYSEALSEYGAMPSPFPYAEDPEAIIGWLAEKFESLPELIGSASDFVVVFSESPLKLLEIKDFADLGRFCSSGLEFLSASSVSMIRANEYVKNIKKNFVKKFWMAGGKKFAKEIARAKLAKVFPAFCFSLMRLGSFLLLMSCLAYECFCPSVSDFKNSSAKGASGGIRDESWR
jgi:hypothetical protein